MRIGIDAHFASYELRGMGKYVVQLVSGLIQVDEFNEYVIYGQPRMFPQPNGRSDVKFRNPGGLPYPVWEQFVLPRWVRQDGVELLHCPANTAPVAIPKDVRLVVTVHDVMYLLPTSVLAGSKVLRQRLGNFYRRTVVPRAAHRADGVIAVSEFSKKEIADYLRMRLDRIHAIHEGVDPGFASLARGFASSAGTIDGQRIDSPFILVLGSGDPRKNTLAMIRAYASVWRELPNQEKLVIAGLRDWRTSSAYQLAAELSVQDRIIFGGYVSEEMLAWLYSSSRCFLYPSLYEGFGFPVLEAMACGTPVITSDCTSIPEVAGDAAILVSPGSEQSIADALRRLLRDESLRSVLIQRGREQARRFSWEATVQKTLGVYRGLSKGSIEPALT